MGIGLLFASSTATDVIWFATVSVDELLTLKVIKKIRTKDFVLRVNFHSIMINIKRRTINHLESTFTAKKLFSLNQIDLLNIFPP